MRGQTLSCPSTAPSNTPVPWGVMHASSAYMTGTVGASPHGGRLYSQASSRQQAWSIPSLHMQRPFSPCGRNEVPKSSNTSRFSLLTWRPTLARVLPHTCMRRALSLHPSCPNTWACRGHHAPIIRDIALVRLVALPCSPILWPSFAYEGCHGLLQLPNHTAHRATPSITGMVAGITTLITLQS